MSSIPTSTDRINGDSVCDELFKILQRPGVIARLIIRAREGLQNLLEKTSAFKIFRHIGIEPNWAIDHEGEKTMVEFSRRKPLNEKVLNHPQWQLAFRNFIDGLLRRGATISLSAEAKGI